MVDKACVTTVIHRCHGAVIRSLIKCLGQFGKDIHRFAIQTTNDLFSCLFTTLQDSGHGFGVWLFFRDDRCIDLVVGIDVSFQVINDGLGTRSKRIIAAAVFCRRVFLFSQYTHRTIFSIITQLSSNSIRALLHQAQYATDDAFLHLHGFEQIGLALVFFDA